MLAASLGCSSGVQNVSLRLCTAPASHMTMIHPINIRIRHIHLRQTVRSSCRILVCSRKVCSEFPQCISHTDESWRSGLRCDSAHGLSESLARFHALHRKLGDPSIGSNVSCVYEGIQGSWLNNPCKYFICSIEGPVALVCARILVQSPHVNSALLHF